MAFRFLTCAKCKTQIHLPAGTSNTGTGDRRTTWWLTLPRNTSARNPRPWLPMTTLSEAAERSVATSTYLNMVWLLDSHAFDPSPTPQG